MVVLGHSDIIEVISLIVERFRVFDCGVKAVIAVKVGLMSLISTVKDSAIEILIV